MKIYHYTKLENWQDIKEGSYQSKDRPGLGAIKQMGKYDPEAFETGAIWALLKPEPENWTSNKDFPEIWQWLKNDIGRLLLEIEIDLDKDPVFVVDWGHREGFLRKDLPNKIPEKYYHQSVQEAERAYMASKISLKEYLERQKELAYSLPEIVVTDYIPLERIKVSDQQHLLEEKLNEWKRISDIYRYNKTIIEHIPELEQWFGMYEEERTQKESELENPNQFREG